MAKNGTTAIETPVINPLEHIEMRLKLIEDNLMALQNRKAELLELKKVLGG